jgi:hypothetical protein
MKWVTRERLKIDRIRCPWLIARFIDKEPEFVYVPADRVRGADTSRLDLTPQSAGLFAISLGLGHVFTNDHEMLKHGMVVYDALFAWCRSFQGETHNWPPKM